MSRPSEISPGGTGREIGIAGEDIAVRYLEDLGMEIIARNHRLRMGEIDIIASDHDELVFVEVKTRRSSAAGGALEAVDPRKSLRLSRLAGLYMEAEGLSGRAARIDAIGIDLTGDEARIVHLEDVVEI